MNNAWVRVTLTTSLFIAIGCGPTVSSGEDGGAASAGVDAGPSSPPPNFSDAGPGQACGRMDILFVIDDSGSMLEEQDNLAANLPMFIDVLDTFETLDGTPIDYRVAVTSTGRTMSWTAESLPGLPFPDSQVGHDGEMLASCGMTRPWLDKGDPDIRDTFACAAQLGTDGAIQEMPLFATKLALGDRVADGTNAGFLREDALLAIVIVTDEDDCSREDNNFALGFDDLFCDGVAPVPSYKTFLDDLTGAPGRWAVATIAGPGPGQCESEFGRADEATRLQEFTAMAGANGVFSSICEGDLASALNSALTTFDAACENLPDID